MRIESRLCSMCYSELETRCPRCSRRIWAIHWIIAAVLVAAVLVAAAMT